MSNTVTTRYDNKALVTFFTLVIILSLAAEAYIVKGGPLWMYFVLMWIPAFSAIIASAVSLKDDKEKFSLKRFLSALGIRKCRIRYIMLAVIISPMAYPGYNWMEQAVSDLSADNASSKALWNQLSSLYGSCGIVSVTCASVFVGDNRVASKMFRTGISPLQYFGIVERCSVFAATGVNAVLGWCLFRGFGSPDQYKKRS